MKKTLLMLLIIFSWCSIDAIGQTREKKVEDDGYVWYEIRKNGRYGAEDTNGMTIIPTQYTSVCYLTGDDGWFSVGDNDGRGAYEKNGKCVISPSRGYSFVNKHKEDDGYWYSVEKGDLKGACDANGNEIIAPRYKSVFYYSVDRAFNYEDSNGEYVNTGISINGSSYASSGNRSSSSSSVNTSVASTPSSSNSGSRYSCNYTRSSQGRNVKTGQYTGAIGNDLQINVVFYNDYILVNGERYNYWGTTNGVKSYMRDDFTGARNIYNVDANYNLQYFSACSNPYTGGYDMWSYEVRKGNTSTPKYNNSVGGYGSSHSGNNGTSTPTSTSSTSSSSNTYQKLCPFCQGSGKCRYCNGKGYDTRMGIGSGTRYCAVCTNHNGICTLCKGTGKQ